MSTLETEQRTEQGAERDRGVGALLKASRLRVGEDLRDVADILRIRYVYLEAIEDGRFDDLPGPTYAAGFVRAYAEHLGLDSGEVVRRFKGRATDEHSAGRLVFPEPIPEPGIPGGAIVFVGIVVAVVAYGVWYMNTSEDKFLAELITPVPDRLAKLAPPPEPQPAAVETPRTPAAAVSSESAAEAANEPETVTEAKPADGSASEPGPATETTPTAAPAATAEPQPQSESTTETTGTATPEPQPPAEIGATPSAAPSPEPAEAAASPPAAGTASRATPEPAPVAETAAATETASSPPAPETAPATGTTAEPAPSAATAQPAGSVAAPSVVPLDVIPPAPQTRQDAPQAQPAAQQSEPTAPTAERVRQPSPQLAPEPAPQAAPETVAATLTPSETPSETTSEIASATPVQAEVSTPTPETAPAPAPAPESETVPVAAFTTQVPETITAPALTGRASGGAATETAIAPAAPPTTTATTGRIVVRAKTNSWIQVRDDAQGELLLTRLLRAGDSYTVPDRIGLTLSTGNAGALEILVDGTAVPTIGGDGVVRRKVALDAEKLKSGTAVGD